MTYPILLQSVLSNAMDTPLQEGIEFQKYKVLISYNKQKAKNNLKQQKARRAQPNATIMASKRVETCQLEARFYCAHQENTFPL